MAPPASRIAAASTVGTAYKRYDAYVRRVLASCGVPARDVPDLSHEVFVVLMRRIEQQDPPQASRGWLFQTARRVASNYRRSTRRARERIAGVLEPEPEPLPDDRVAQADAAAFITRFLNELEPTARRLFVLSEIDGIRGTEIAARFELNLKTTYARVYALRRRFEREAAREFGRPLLGRGWLLFVGLDGQRFRALRRALWLKIAAAAVVIAALVTWWVIRSGPNAAPAPVGPIATWDPRGEIELRERLETETFANRDRSATLTGTVRDAAGPGIAAATVCVWRHGIDVDLVDHSPPLCTSTDDDGRYRLDDVTPGDVRVTAAAAGFVPGELRRGPAATHRVIAGEHGGLDVVLERGGVGLSGIVEDMTGGPIESVTIVLTAEPSPGGGDPLTFGGWGDKPPIVVVSDTHGRFATSVAPGLQRWYARADGYAATRGETTPPSEALVIRLAPEAVLAGVVVDAQSGAPLPNMRVVASANPRSLADATAGIDTDGAGRFRITGLPPGRYKPWASAPGRLGVAPRSVVLGLGETIEDVRIPVAAAPIVRAVVTIASTGEPCPSGAVALREEGGERLEVQHIGDHGEVVFAVVLPGRYRPQVACAGYRSAASYPVVDAGHYPATDLSWTVHDGLILSGDVRRSNGTPAEDALVSIVPIDGAIRLPRAQRADASGRFAVTGLGEGRYAVSASGRGETTSYPIEIELAPDAGDIALRLVTGGTVRGIVVDPDGAPVPNAVVRVRAPDTGTGHSLRTDADGRFELAALPLGPYVVVAARGEPPAAAPQHRVELDATRPIAEVHLQVMTQTATIAGRVVDEGDAPIVDALVTIEGSERGITIDASSSLSDATGRFELNDVSPGPHTLVAVAPDGVSARLSVTSADDGVRIVIPTSASAEGTIAVDGAVLPTVFEVSAAGPDQRRVSEVFMSSGGKWALDGLTPGLVTFSAVTALGRAAANVTLAAGENRTGIELRLLGRVEVAGRILDLETGRPLPDYVVVATAFDDGMEELGKQAEIAFVAGPADTRQLTGTEGRFVIAGVAAGVVNLAGFPKGFPETELREIRTIARVPFDGEIDLFATRLRAGPEDEKGATGLELDRGDYDQPWTIVSVEADGPAAPTGLRPGDAITAVDGHDVTGVYKYLLPFLLNATPGTTVSLTLDRGATVDLTLAR